MGINNTNNVNSDKAHNEKTKKSVPNVFSRMFYCWMFPLYYYGNRRDLDENDLVPSREVYSSHLVGDKLEKEWLKEQATAKANGTEPSFKMTLFRAFFWTYLPGGLMQFAYVAIRTGTPLLFAELLNYWSVGSTVTATDASIYAVSMILANWLGAFLNHHGNLYCQQFGMKLRIATSSLMFRKIMRMDNASLGDTTAGKVVNLLSNDLSRFDMAFLFFHYLWIIPLQLAAVCYLGYTQTGVSAFIGLLALVIIALPAQAGLGRLIGKVRMSTATKTDDRIKLMSEVINGIQVIKMYAWESPFEKMVNEKREIEMRQVRNGTLLRTLFLGFMLFTERTALFLTILTFIFMGNSMSANVIYPLQQFMAAAQINITLVLPLTLAFIAELLVSLQRVQEFLNMKDRSDLAPRLSHTSHNLFRNLAPFDTDGKSSVRPLSYNPKSSIADNKGTINIRRFSRSISVAGDIVMEIKDVTASWTGDPNMLALNNISMRLRRNKLCAIIGSVGSGKSSFLQLLLKELPAASGSFTINGTISYASQEPWLFPSTVRENILFGLPFDDQKYKEVCKVCTLEKDFKQFPFGDQTLVGERGVSLSGGQRARINLARAVYRDSDIYLLDDPLSAVDANVGRKLFEGCINGYLRGKTRILVTHQLHFLKAADYIVILNKGSVENMGTFDELAAGGKDFSTLLSELQEGKDKDSESHKSDSSGKGLHRQISVISEKDDDENFEAQKLDPEERQSGNLKWEVVSAYFLSSGSALLIILTVFMILLTAAAAASVDYWVSYWGNQMANYELDLDGEPIDPGLDVQVGRFTTAQYLIIHGCLIVVVFILTNVRIFPFVQLCTLASKNLHNGMFSRMLTGIMRFFDTSSSGRILNRFTKDMGALDEVLPRTLLDVFQIYSTLLAILILNAIALYWTLVPSLVLLILFGYAIKIYMRTAQAVKRLESTTKSPVFGMVTSSLSGMATIRSTKAEVRLVKEFDMHQDLHTYAWNGFLGGGASFGFYLDTMCLVYLATIIFVFIFIDFGGVVAVGSVGLAVTQSNMLTAMLQHGARMFVEFLAQLTSVERVLEYTKIESERNLTSGQITTQSSWPSKGNILFQNVNMSYGPNEMPVLKDLNVFIEHGWKVGIVGRTGAGKSSLISALFRFAYIEGHITIDGIETSSVSLQNLRSKISIIPQEPVLFSATIRYNLDPFNIYTDEDLWRSLEQVDLKDTVPSLDYKVTEGGSNFSVGQRQLMCLARAILRSNKILIMDEATANVDPQTDNFIQQTIRKQFASCTVLTIAHRLNTIMDSDRVLVMDTGKVAEFDHPYTLLLDPKSMFSSMVKETGEKMADKLMEEAKEAFFQSNFEEASRLQR